MMQKTLGLGIRNAFEAEDMKLKTAKNYIGDPFPHFCQAPPSSGESNPWNCPNVVEGRNQCCVPNSAYSLGLAENGSHQPMYIKDHQGTWKTYFWQSTQFQLCFWWRCLRPQVDVEVKS